MFRAHSEDRTCSTCGKTIEVWGAFTREFVIMPSRLLRGVREPIRTVRLELTFGIEHVAKDDPIGRVYYVDAFKGRALYCIGCEPILSSAELAQRLNFAHAIYRILRDDADLLPERLRENRGQLRHLLAIGTHLETLHRMWRALDNGGPPMSFAESMNVDTSRMVFAPDRLEFDGVSTLVVRAAMYAASIDSGNWLVEENHG